MSRLSSQDSQVAGAVAAGRRLLPRGKADFALQIAIWFGFLAAYQVARGIAARNPARAFENGLKVIDVERSAGALWELTFQRLIDSSALLAKIASWTYWNSEFTVVALALLWIYVFRNEEFTRFRNLILLANVVGLVGYVLLPTAPPRMFPDIGFVDTLADFGGLNHGSGLIQLAANPYAAMPSLHAADALIVGLTLARVVRNPLGRMFWAVWPLWVWFCVMATGNHFWLDIVAGIVVALIAAAVLYRRELRRLAPWAAA